MHVLEFCILCEYLLHTLLNDMGKLCLVLLLKLCTKLSDDISIFWNIHRLRVFNKRRTGNAVTKSSQDYTRFEIEIYFFSVMFWQNVSFAWPKMICSWLVWHCYSRFLLAYFQLLSYGSPTQPCGFSQRGWIFLGCWNWSIRTLSWTRRLRAKLPSSGPHLISVMASHWTCSFYNNEIFFSVSFLWAKFNKLS